MSNTNLSLNFNSPTTSNFYILPLFFNYTSGVQVRILLSASKADLTSLLTGLDEIFNQTQISVEDFYQALDNLVHPTKPFRGEVTLTAVFIGEDHSILVFTFGGAVILRRGQTAGVLATGHGSEPVAKAGQLKAGDTLVLFNSPSPVLTKPLVENLEQAKAWTDFSLFGQAYLAQADFENLGFYLVNQSILADEEITVTESESPSPSLNSTDYTSHSTSDDEDDEDEEETDKMGFLTFIKSKVPFLNRPTTTPRTSSRRHQDQEDDEDQASDLIESDDNNIFPETAESSSYSSHVTSSDTADYYRRSSSSNSSSYGSHSATDYSRPSNLGSIDSPEDESDSSSFSRRPRPHSSSTDRSDDFNLDKLDDIYRRRS